MPRRARPPRQPSAVIVPTWRRCASIADRSVDATRGLWPGHPPIWILTDAGDFSHPHVTRTDDAATGGPARSDWVGVTRHGVTALVSAGHLTEADWVLLVLDDHAPARPVEGALVDAAIRAAEARGAPYVRLHGRAASGVTRVGAVMDRSLVVVDRSWPWYHSLHPAAWQVAYLLDVLAAAETAGRLDPWSFEGLELREREHVAVLGAWPSPFGGYLHRGRVDLGAALGLRHPATRPLRRALLRAWFRDALTRSATGTPRRLRALSASLATAISALSPGRRG